MTQSKYQAFADTNPITYIERSAVVDDLCRENRLTELVIPEPHGVELELTPERPILWVLRIS